mmetsp:Transcript_65259/g.155913  ORF Transcript_65259/g.155913 Transcript_65259/m.155913 type:complete len:377 (+) Transcript_65259:154-1284(+)|eukprot:CAMPEP_0178408910 /NCGR_PEP_ID=MMETSP0689_2-20121128/20187_1 /TAXON_ID=160604 /ORGANISM="Amphidinium massartii, Strain CS-259" /LENGTH=376 /DNA_ID=CAMNT_0020030029 /DNA_START=64 /DNA_END=1194 /DNA_ORIENTATION=+
MAPKAAPSKAEQKAKEKIAVDKTFGLKNKNKSKVVQQYIKSVNANLKGETNAKKQEEQKAKEQKQKAIQAQALNNALFNMATDKKGRAFDATAKKKAKEEEENAVAAGKKLSDETKKKFIEAIANTIRLTNPKTGIRLSEMGGHPIIQNLKETHADIFRTVSLMPFIKANPKVFWVDDQESTNPTIRCQEDVEAEVAPDERPIEEIIEERRRALPPGGTPVTKDTFEAWKLKREAERLERVEKDREELAKKTGGKGLAAMSGRDLFTYDASLFVDDDDAADAGAYDDREERLSSDEEAADSESEDSEGEDDEDDEEDEGTGGAASSSGARGSADPAPEGAKFAPPPRGGEEVPINKDLFLEGEDLPDDALDDLEDD